MLFSIIVPVYNVEKYLNECLDSIIRQVIRFPDDCEIILVDDGSTDKSGQICDTYKEKYHLNIKVYHNDNHGLLYTRRFAYKKSSGKYIVNCDSDDLLENNAIELFRNTITANDEPDVILYNYNSYDGKTKKTKYESIFFSESAGVVSKDKVLSEYLVGHKIVSLATKIYKRECANIEDDYARFGRLSTGEDTLQTIEIFSNAKTFYYINHALYDYRTGSGMTNKFDSNYYLTFKKIFLELIKKKNQWNLNNFDELYSIKILQTAGRAITQSRYNKWESLFDQIKYLESIRKDDLYISYKKYLKKDKLYLQKDHYVLLKYLNYKWDFLIVFLLFIKNKI